MNLVLIASLISSALAFGVGFSAAWTMQGRKIDSINLESANERIATQRSYRTSLERYMSRVSEAQAHATDRIRTAALELDSNRVALERLRNSSDAALRNASESAANCAVAVTAYSELFAECRGELVTLANKADKHVSDIRLNQQVIP